MQTLHPHRAFDSIHLPPSQSRITVFPGGNIKISNVLKISPRLCEVPLGLRYQGIGSSINFSGFFFHQSGMARAGSKKLQATLCQPQLHHLAQALAKIGHAYM